jgi:uncharacterized protein (DUF302 family)
MKTVKYLIVALVAFIIGSGFAGAALSLAAPQMLIKEVASPYDFEKTVRVIEERLNAKAGWHVITTYDQNAEVQAHGGSSIGKMALIQYCSGSYASRMLAADERKKLSAMMPKNISVYEDSKGQVHIAMSNGAVMGKLFGGETEALIEEVSREIEAVMGFMHFKFSLY